MPLIHIANTHFEKELAGEITKSFENSLKIHPNFLQLSYLPLIYREKGEYACLPSIPTNDYLHHIAALNFPTDKIITFRDLNKDFLIEPWGHSSLIQQFAGKHGIKYEIPSAQILRNLSSKQLSHTLSPLPGSKLLWDETDLSQWIKTTPGNKVLKSCYGFSGRGHFHLDESVNNLSKIPPNAKNFFIHETKKHGRPIIAEPWLKRVFDFSSQWQIRQCQPPLLLGIVRLENTFQGKYLKNIAAKKLDTLFTKQEQDFVLKHIAFVRPLIHQFGLEGYFGYLGVDAMVYENQQTLSLQPMVEVNPRKTFGFIALRLQAKCDSPSIAITYTNKPSTKAFSLLPSRSGNHAFTRRMQCILHPYSNSR